MQYAAHTGKRLADKLTTKLMFCMCCVLNETCGQPFLVLRRTRFWPKFRGLVKALGSLEG
jgi:hypothetical protein